MSGFAIDPAAMVLWLRSPPLYIVHVYGMESSSPVVHLHIHTTDAKLMVPSLVNKICSNQIIHSGHSVSVLSRQAIAKPSEKQLSKTNDIRHPRFCSNPH